MVQCPVAERLGAFTWVSHQFWQASWYGVDADEGCRTAIAKQLEVDALLVVEFSHWIECSIYDAYGFFKSVIGLQAAYLLDLRRLRLFLGVLLMRARARIGLHIPISGINPISTRVSRAFRHKWCHKCHK